MLSKSQQTYVREYLKKNVEVIGIVNVNIFLYKKWKIIMYNN